MRQLLDYTAKLAHKDILIEERAQASGHSATVNVVERYGPVHLIQYQPEQREYRDHFVAHECGHLVRWYQAPADDRVVPVSSRQHRASAAGDVQDKLISLHRHGIPEEALGELLTMWHQGLVTQLTNFPADLRIERWLCENYRGLADVQERSIRHQLEENELVLRSTVERFTAPEVYDSSATINAAFASYMSRLYDDDALAGRYRYSRYWRRGQELAEEIWTSEDRGYAGDVATTTEWAELFDVADWFEWRHVDELRDQNQVMPMP